MRGDARNGVTAAEIHRRAFRRAGRLVARDLRTVQGAERRKHRLSDGRRNSLDRSGISQPFWRLASFRGFWLTADVETLKRKASSGKDDHLLT